MSVARIIIRPFRMSDYDSVISLWDETELPYRPEGRDSRARIQKETRLRRSVFLVAELDGRVVGTVLATHDGRKGWLNRLAVEKGYRRHGLARRLAEQAERRLNGLGLDVIACLIESDNAISMKTFERLGYEKSDLVYYSKRKNAGS